jgi:hypothetical protein
MRRLIGILFLFLQLSSFVYARFVPSRWLAWAPNDYAVDYSLRVQVRERVLSKFETEERYGLPAKSLYENPPQNIMDIVRQYEQTYGRKDHAGAVLQYRLNGGPPQQWRWPEN